MRKLKKYYPTIINPLLIKSDFPKIFEQAVVNESKGEFFWRDSYKNEVDLILTKPELTAIEIKSGEIKREKLSSLKKFIEKYKPKKAFIVSYKADKSIGGINVIPFYDYFLKTNPS